MIITMRMYVRISGSAVEKKIPHNVSVFKGDGYTDVQTGNHVDVKPRTVCSSINEC